MKQEATIASGGLVLSARPSRLRWAWRLVRRKPLGAASMLLIAALVLCAVLAPVVAPYDPMEQRATATFASPQPQFMAGTDNLGRDIFSRIIWGAQVSLVVGVLSVGIGGGVGGFLGLLSGYFGGRLDMVMQRFVDALLAFPNLILAMIIVVVLQPTLMNVVITVAIILVSPTVRVIRSAAISVKANEYVQAARAIGASDLRILLRHAAPNCMAPFIVLTTAQISTAILTEATLGFLGLGIRPPTPTWGSMLSEGRQYVNLAPWMAVYPGVAVSLAVYGFNLLGDTLRDELDPRLRGGGGHL
ncbi:MAG: ABC transporter permease [Dehalococcoidia bacterium]|nr:ABC transporter permease [Dehalococcoidia bacterium]